MPQLPDLQPGWHEPLGALARDGGVNFAVFSENATRIELCVFDGEGQRELRRYALDGPHDGVWHGFLPGVGPGLVYGLRAHGPYEPAQGHRFNPRKLLLDPYAREIVGRFGWRAEHHGYELGHPDGPRSIDHRDNATQALKARVAPPPRAGERPARPRRAPADVVLYEVHVKGFSKLLPGVPEELRGTYAGLAHPAAIAHFKRLGVTTLSLLPVHYCIDEPHLAERGLHNFWGYNTLGFFCPDPRWAQAAHRQDPTAAAAEFRQMVDALHHAGLEVVLDVVYNHTPEGNEFGPTLSLRGLDNKTYYRLVAGDWGRYENLTGCGNTLHCSHPRVTQFVLDSLRFWVTDLGVDGFRFDLAPVLGRSSQGFDPNAAFFTALRQDPVLAGVHLIAEPWDAAYDGYQVGRFPGRFLEWNDKFRDTVRSYWLGVGASRGEFARRFTASSDVFHHGQRQPMASINFIAVHDGFTLADLTSYSAKHNQANGEDNRDGRDGELCANFGVEGPTDDAAIAAARDRVRRAMLATLLLAQGTPMLCAGDEIGNSQGGNNNAYCQDNETTWLDWACADDRLTGLVAALLALRSQEPLLRHPRWFAAGAGEASIAWYAPSGHEMTPNDWHDAGQRAFGAQLREAGAAAPRLMIVFNPDAEPLPCLLCNGPWQLVLDSSGESAAPLILPGQPLSVPGRSLVVLRHV
ncbi:glycogen debranching protein GlgX [Roseateles cellulosilyticus]|uniref:Glycogen debranching protein GlgX n=1 Tax=Pelomonas cellulosilytica TaxID=2906762 RepID=A0ABS8XTX5_9BURK|nr:glycogen debranching protein GlgX [Pelomonas sp. P8]MCE4555187.1 glycogen debranching protein GlgX [Pelomonas sp. P8]